MYIPHSKMEEPNMGRDNQYVGFMWEFPHNYVGIFSHMPKNPHKSHMLISYRKYVGFFYKGKWAYISEFSLTY